MELFNIVLVIILGMLSLSKERIRYLIEIIFSSITGLWLWRIFNSKVGIISPTEWNNAIAYEWIISGNAVKAFFFTGISYLFFYKGFIRIILKNIIVNPLDKYFKNLTSKIDSEFMFKVFKAALAKWLRKTIRRGYKLGLISTKKSDPIKKSNYDESGYETFSFVLHLIFCWFILGVNKGIATYLLVIIILIIITIRIVAIAIVNPVFDFLSNIIEHEEKLTL